MVARTVAGASRAPRIFRGFEFKVQALGLEFRGLGLEPHAQSLKPEP